MKNILYLAADGRRQKLDSISYRLPTWHPIYSMPFGQGGNSVYSPVRAEHLTGGICLPRAMNHPEESSHVKSRGNMLYISPGSPAGKTLFISIGPLSSALSSVSGRQNNYRGFDKT